MLALSTLGINIHVYADLALTDLWQLSVDVVGEGTKVLDVNRVAASECVIQISDETSPDDKHLQ